MTDTIVPAESPAVAEPPHVPRPATDAAALRAIEEATAHLGERALKAILDTFASKDMPGRPRHIQECVDQILAKVDSTPAAG